MDIYQTARNLLQFHPGKQRVCAIATYKGNVTAIAVNSYVKTHPVQKEYAKRVGHPDQIYLHAEIRALLRARNCDSLHVFRLNKQGEFVNAKPCPICELAAADRYVKRIFHT